MFSQLVEEKTEKFIDQIMKDEVTSLIKSKQRVQERGEVFTPRNIVKDMMDLEGVKELSYELDSTFLEPSCGNGNFLIQILARKLMLVNIDNIDIDTARALCSIYGVDIDKDNVVESRERMLKAIEILYYNNNKTLDDSIRKSFKYILNRNIILGNTLENRHFCETHGMTRRERIKNKELKLLDSREDNITGEDDGVCNMLISEWNFSSDGSIERKEVTLKDMCESNGDCRDYVSVYEPVNLVDLHTQEDKVIDCTND